MKLIIDISEEEYKSILSYVQVYNSHYADMIRNGKPFEETTNGDLISRSALKEAFEDTVCIEPMPYAFVKQIIDNALTVEERPKGEWTITKEGYVECPFCKCKREIPENYCGYCGADMRV